jgi:hypothetical protein
LSGPRVESVFYKLSAVWRITTLPERPQALFAMTAENVPLVDVYTALNADITTFIGTIDGLHPTPAGYARIASTFLDAIEKNLEQTSGVASLARTSSSAKRAAFGRD